MTNLSAGTVSSPGLSFQADSNTGIYRSAADTVDITAGGVRSARFNTIATGVNFVDFTPAATGSDATMLFTGSDANAGGILNTKAAGTGTLKLQQAGTTKLTIGASFLTIVDAAPRVTGNTASAFLYSDANKGLASSAAPTNGQLLIGSTGAIPAVASLTAGAGIDVTGGAGTITVAVGTGEVVTTMLNTATGSATLAGDASGDITMNDYSFAPSLTNAGGADTDAHRVTPQTQVADPTNTVARIGLEVQTGAVGDVTTVRWRYVTSSRPPELVLMRDVVTGTIKGAWMSEIQDFDNPPMSAAGCECVFIADFPDRLMDQKVMSLNIFNQIKEGKLSFIVDEKDHDRLTAKAKEKGRLMWAGAKVAELR